MKQKLLSLCEPFDYKRLMEEINTMSDKYPFLRVNYLCNSILSRPIPIIEFGSGSRNVFYIGAHHGMEWLTSALLLCFLNELCECYVNCKRIEKIETVALWQSYQLCVIPMLNPDGVEYQIHGIDESNPLYDRLKKINPSLNFANWQANARGVDLNHNYDFGFLEYKKLEQENQIKEGASRYSGEAPQSEPEVMGLCNRISFAKDVKGILTLHTQGEEICYPSAKDGISHKTHWIAKKLTSLTGYRLIHPKGLAAYGGLTDWANIVCGIPAFTVECGKGQNPLPIQALPAIYSTLRRALFAFPTLL